MNTNRHAVPRLNKSPYTRWDATKGAWVKRTFEELNDTPPPKRKEHVRRDRDGRVVIEVTRAWQEKKTGLIVVIHGVYPSTGMVLYSPHRSPTEHHRTLDEVKFRAAFTPWDLVPD